MNHLQIIMEESKQGLIPPLILLLDPFIRQVGPRSHPPMHLIPKSLYVLRPLEIGLKPIHQLRILVLAREHTHRDANLLRILRVHHRGVQLRSGLELGIPRAGERHHFPAPAVPDDPPALDRAIPLLRVLQHAWDLAQSLARLRLVLDKSPELLALLLRVRRVPANIGGAAHEEIGHEDLVLVLLVAVCEDIGALQRLREVPEDVVDYEDGLGGIAGAGHVGFEAVEGFVGAFGLVAF
jgi:hypothetical protein